LNHLRLPDQPRAEEHAGWNPFVQASATDRGDLSHLTGSEGGRNGEMLGMLASYKGFYLSFYPHFFSLSPSSWIQSGTAKLPRSQQLLVLPQRCGSLEQLSGRQQPRSTPGTQLSAPALAKRRHHSHREPAPMQALRSPKLLQRV